METPVLIIGCGPIGITGALLLARHGIRSVLIERRGELNTHPRSRFVDTNTMELMREFGVEKEVEATGLGPDWTQVNRWSVSLCEGEVAAIPSPTFLTVPRETSPCLPVMTCQDYVENILIELARKNPLIDLRFNTEMTALEQDAHGVHAVLRNTASGQEDRCEADYAIGADGPGSVTRSIIGAELDAEPRAGFMQDVIFDADLSAWVGDRKGALLYTMTTAGVVIFQPLNGVRRWRCQISVQDENMISESDAIERIRLAAGADALTDISILSMSKWRPTPGLTSTFSKGRIFIAGDAAHIAVPAGGMGNNAGFAGIRNLAWKLAYVLNGAAPASILESYETEHRPIAQERVDMGVKIYEAVVPIFVAHFSGQDAAETAKGAWFYADYDGVILGFEMSSDLIAAESEAAPALASPISDYVPMIRNGRRAPHVWTDPANSHSTLDWFGTDYVLVAGAHVASAEWQVAVDELVQSGFPVALRQLTSATTPYDADTLVLVRPDGIIADHWSNAEIAAGLHATRLRQSLPFTPISQAVDPVA